ncbi:turripeptide Pal9.2 [Uranotaenia lowii]|uniref:turripeptide Pal9.2 n=1 Tax=Uranotaenia lowii TaxID=190385 RepID=UPI002478C452|nr:turripeptide Pal9.2 [Uranotaenia lowii]
MRYIFIVLVSLMAIVALVQANPANEPAKKVCGRSCTFDYTPVCGGVKGSNDKPLSFGNTCVMEKYNCENGKSLTVLSQGECPGGGGVRLA